MSEQIWTPQQAQAAANQFSVNVGFIGNQVSLAIQYPNAGAGCTLSILDARQDRQEHRRRGGQGGKR